MAFKDATLSPPPNGSGGSASSPTTQKVTDPGETTLEQAFQKNGSLGTLGSGGGVVEINAADYNLTQIKEKQERIDLTSPTPLADLADPVDPAEWSTKTPDFAYPKTDQDQLPVADPTSVTDPNSSALQPDPTRAATEPLKVGSRVEIVLAGSKYQGQTGIVRRVFQNQGLTVYTVQLSGGKRIDYQLADLKLVT